jgi:nitrile hydratase beta subunit
MSYVSHADLGGRSGFGPIVPEPEGELFHAAWEPRALALTLAMGATGSWNLDMGRSARETLPNYTGMSYYEIWLRGLEKLLVERQLVQGAEIAAGRATHPAQHVARVLAAADVPAVLAKGGSTLRATTAPARFAPGEHVRTRADRVAHHTRLPDYVRGKAGVIERLHGMHVFPDAHAQGLGEEPQWLYTVAFDGATLWNDAARAGLTVSVDAFEPYLEAA